MTNDPNVSHPATLISAERLAAARPYIIAALKGGGSVDDCIRGALAAADRAAWQAIETAPTNVSVLVFIPDREHYGPGIYRAILVDMGTGRRWHSTGVFIGRDIGPDNTPTRWRPLPSTPGDEA